MTPDLMTATIGKHGKPRLNRRTLRLSNGYVRQSLLQFSGLALPAAEQGGAEGLEVKECRDAALATDWLVESNQPTLAF